MKKGILILSLVIAGMLLGCNSSELVENWKNPEISTFEASKVLVIGMTNDEKNRKNFEKQLVKELKSQNVNAFTSNAFFDNDSEKRPLSEKELDLLEYELLKEGYDAILVSKIIGAEDMVTLVQAYSNFNKTFNSFSDDYYSSQAIYAEDERIEKYTVYHAESAVYCICPEKEREVIWKGSIDITDPGVNTRKAIKDYVKVLLWALEENEVLVFPTIN